jgi:hypothetical protein
MAFDDGNYDPTDTQNDPTPPAIDDGESHNPNVPINTPNPQDEQGLSAPVVNSGQGVEDDSTGVDQQVAQQGGRFTNAIKDEDDDTAQAALQQQGQPPAQNGQLGNAGPDQQRQDNIKKMLAGEGAVNPGLIQKINAQSRRGLRDTPADTGVYAIHDAVMKHGLEAGKALVQGNRVLWGTYNTYALQALNGSAEKRPDLKAAIDAANKAQDHMPDGSNVIFSPNGNHGVIAVVQMPGSTHTVQYNLSIPQFKQVLDVGNEAQFDKVFNTGVPAMLQRLSNAQAGMQSDGDTPQSQTPTQSPAAKLKAQDQADDDEEDAKPPQKDPDRSTIPGRAGPSDEESNAQNLRDGAGYQPKRYSGPHAQSLDKYPGRDMEFAGNLKSDEAIDTENARHGLGPGDQPPIPGTHDKNGNYVGKVKQKSPYGSDLEERSTLRFGKGNVNAEPARQQWMANEQSAAEERKNKLEGKRLEGVNAEKKVRLQNEGKAATDASHERIAHEKALQWEFSTKQKHDAAMARVNFLYDQEARKDARSDKTSELGYLKAKMAAGQRFTDEDNEIAKKYRVAADQQFTGTPQAPTPQARTSSPTTPQSAQKMDPAKRARAQSWLNANPNHKDAAAVRKILEAQ